MASVDRADFYTLSKRVEDCYDDCPMAIGFNATISAPHMHAFALEAAAPFVRPDTEQHVLDVGSGSGYLCVAFATLFGPNGRVYGVEHIQELVEVSRRNSIKHHAHLLETGRVHFVCEDGRSGFLPGAPYDVVHVGAASEEIPPALIEQTKLGGVIIIPVGRISDYQVMKVMKKLGDGSLKDVGSTSWTVRYVPLTDTTSQLQ
jgi:protein-L-isoaspartate(D-aspartate) O-methyltransferase